MSVPVSTTVEGTNKPAEYSSGEMNAMAGDGTRKVECELDKAIGRKQACRQVGSEPRQPHGRRRGTHHVYVVQGHRESLARHSHV